ncbi:basic proline-rich protein-like [Myiozetetes cayanensis]|uniref:basic proline-rich protein-like n=1 Tax=Myiozetetes cayanensis TaxID=478635 RepID=UPI00215E0189|nr:basic proline-rich protein-like [Myiozetetes cayanensis]
MWVSGEGVPASRLRPLGAGRARRPRLQQAPRLGIPGKGGTVREGPWVQPRDDGKGDTGKRCRAGWRRHGPGAFAAGACGGSGAAGDVRAGGGAGLGWRHSYRAGSGAAAESGLAGTLGPLRCPRPRPGPRYPRRIPARCLWRRVTPRRGTSPFPVPGAAPLPHHHPPPPPPGRAPAGAGREICAPVRAARPRRGSRWRRPRAPPPRPRYPRTAQQAEAPRPLPPRLLLPAAAAHVAQAAGGGSIGRRGGGPVRARCAAPPRRLPALPLSPDPPPPGDYRRGDRH